MKNNPVAWFEIYVQDMSRARSFYEAVFQGTLTHLPAPAVEGEEGLEMWAFPSSVDGPGAAGALVRAPGCPSGGSTMVYFTCDDCAEEGSRAAAHGGKVVRDKMSIGPYGFIVLVEDTEGNMIGLHSMR